MHLARQSHGSKLKTAVALSCVPRCMKQCLGAVALSCVPSNMYSCNLLKFI